MRFFTFIIVVALASVVNTHIYAQLYSLTSTDFFIYFDSDSYTVSAKQQQLLMDKIVGMGATNIKEIYVEGHTDTFASDAYNEMLARNRALATVDILERIGVPARFIKMESFGESDLASELHHKNRRAKVFFVYETDHKSELSPPKWVVIKTIDKKTKKAVKASIGFEYEGQDIKFSSTGNSGVSSAFNLLTDIVTISASAPHYLSAYFTVPSLDIDRPIDTLVYTIELIRVKITGKFTFQNIYFFTDSDEIRPESQPELNKLLAILKRHSGTYLEIQGHMNFPVDRPTNSVQRQWNMELSYKRAKAINNYLVTSGIDQKQLTYVGMSNFRMKHKLPTNKEQEDQNKRVEIYTLKEL